MLGCRSLEAMSPETSVCVGTCSERFVSMLRATTSMPSSARSFVTLSPFKGADIVRTKDNVYLVENKDILISYDIGVDRESEQSAESF